jgi:hypothetical protein
MKSVDPNRQCRVQNVGCSRHFLRFIRAHAETIQGASNISAGFSAFVFGRDEPRNADTTAAVTTKPLVTRYTIRMPAICASCDKGSTV